MIYGDVFMELDYVSLGKRIREKRLLLNFTQEHLAEIADIEPSNLSHIERAATKVSLPTLVRIANALNVTLDELIFDSLRNNTHIVTERVALLLADCTDEEIYDLAEILEPIKNILRKHNTTCKKTEIQFT